MYDVKSMLVPNDGNLGNDTKVPLGEALKEAFIHRAAAECIRRINHMGSYGCHREAIKDVAHAMLRAYELAEKSE